METGTAPLPIASGHERQGRLSGAVLALINPLRSHSHIWAKNVITDDTHCSLHSPCACWCLGEIHFRDAGDKHCRRIIRDYFHGDCLVYCNQVPQIEMCQSNIPLHSTKADLPFKTDALNTLAMISKDQPSPDCSQNGYYDTWRVL